MGGGAATGHPGRDVSRPKGMGMGWFGTPLNRAAGADYALRT